MQQDLVNKVRAIWNQKIATPNATLQTISDIIHEWKNLFTSSYGQSDCNGCGGLSDALSIASRTLGSNGYWGAAIRLLINAWKETGKRQETSKIKIYRAAIAF